MPGEFYFGQGDIVVKTLLGSCVAATLWHPRLHIGGMCHVVIPDDNENVKALDCDSRYAGCAMQKFMAKVQASGMPPKQFQVGLFGGGKMFSTVNNQPGLDIGARNADMMQRLLKKHGFSIDMKDVCENKYRHVFMELANGEINVRAMDVENTMG